MKKQEILDAFWFRHACKEFDVTKKITNEDFDFILETARLSPSSFGFEPWHFVVVQDKELRELLKADAWGAQQKLETASHFVLCLTLRKPFLTWDSAYLTTFMKEVQQLPEDAIKGRQPFIANFQNTDFELTDERTFFDWAGKQCYIALGNMMTSAAMIGIDSCPMEGFHQKKTERLLKEHLDVDIEKYGLSYMVAFGYRIQQPPAKTRRQLSDIVTWK